MKGAPGQPAGLSHRGNSDDNQRGDYLITTRMSSARKRHKQVFVKMQEHPKLYLGFKRGAATYHTREMSKVRTTCMQTSSLKVRTTYSFPRGWCNYVLKHYSLTREGGGGALTCAESMGRSLQATVPSSNAKAHTYNSVYTQGNLIYRGRK